ncbi:hypothetical protein [Legionella spiritensis]|uniref:Lipoprotein n=1 Tax=Legionella spiritensis TaxID=452 RepID=A0A0W0ZAL4_LEGSP|nr:hypothetical protein [Legionella spiritensis]KTD66161.1 hypothetical protein Lspi_0224 [Legionella spiritensis]SNV43854.1 Uncharacterised protein [Legionella spiritensis]VEG90704.1 Uncharacterised protein [Legionella spiritensis]
MKKIVFVVASILFVTGCSSHHGGNGDDQRYLKSRNGPGVVVPPPLTDSNISHFYDLPRQDKKAGENIAPPNGGQ